MAEPPLFRGGVNVITASPLPAVAVPIIGASGTSEGITVLLGAEALPVPDAFVAVTVKVYEVPFVSHVTVSGEEPPVAVNPPGLEVTVYEVMALPPLLTGAEKVIVASPLPRVAVPMVGAPGTVDGVAIAEAVEEEPIPTSFTAETLKV